MTMPPELPPLPRYLQLLWGRETEGRRGPKPGRSIHEIGQAAVAIADAEGLDGVSMKSVATAVGFTTMSLYRYVDSKDELYAVMVDIAYGPPSHTYAASDDWRARITKWSKEIARRRLDHPWTTQAVLSSPPVTPNSLAWTESGLAALTDTPLSHQQKLSAMLALDGWGQNHVRQTVQMGLLNTGQHPGSDRDDGSGQDAAAAYREEHSYSRLIGRLIDPRQFPQLAAAGPAALDDDDEDFFTEEFDRGLGLILDGVEALIARGA